MGVECQVLGAARAHVDGQAVDRTATTPTRPTARRPGLVALDAAGSPSVVVTDPLLPRHVLRAPEQIHLPRALVTGAPRLRRRPDDAAGRFPGHRPTSTALLRRSSEAVVRLGDHESSREIPAGPDGIADVRRVGELLGRAR